MSGLRHPWTGLTRLVNLGVLTRWFPPELVAAAVSGRVRPSRRPPSPLTPEFMVYFTLGLALWANDSYLDVLENLTAAVPELAGASVDKSSLHAARVKLGQAPMAEVFAAVAAGEVARAGTAGARWRGRLVLAVDGFMVDVPDTAANRAAFGGPKVAGRNGPYPQAKVVTLTECGTHGLRAAAIGGYATGERELAEQLLGGRADTDCVVLFDAGFPSVRLLKLAVATGTAVVMRASTRIAGRITDTLPDGTVLAQIREQGKNKSPSPQTQATIRVIDYRIDGGDPVRLLTTLTDPHTAPAAEIAALYAERWQTEQAFREIKTIQAGRGYVLRSGSPDLIRAEIWAHLALHVALNRLAVDLADHNQVDPDRISFVKVLKHARRTAIAQITGIAKAAAGELRRWLNPPRRPRTSPRAVKRLRHHRYHLRPTTSPGQPVTVHAPPRTLTLQPHHA
jgi:Insertion element 4 transposase N-terminal/Transposase DDE domain